MLGNTLVAEYLVGSQEGLSSMEVEDTEMSDDP
jgi:hypothetical protein